MGACCALTALNFGIRFFSSGFASGTYGFAFFVNVGGLAFGAFRLGRLVDGGLLSLVRRWSGGRVRALAGSNEEHLNVPSGCWPVLRVVSWVMPRRAGRRWLGEAESVAFEIAGERRGKALRSMVWSAPNAAAVMWLSEISRWAGLAVPKRGGAGRRWG